MSDCIPCQSKNKKPLFMKMIKEGIKSAPRIARQVVNGMFVSPEMKKHRMDICKKCEHFYPATKQCTNCTCYLDGKTALACEECPIQKWMKVGECQ